MDDFELNADCTECIVKLKSGGHLEMYIDNEGLHIEGMQANLAVTRSTYNDGLLIFPRKTV